MANTFSDYYIELGEDQMQLASRVRERLDGGWVPLGGVSVAFYGSGPKYQKWMFSQAMGKPS